MSEKSIDKESILFHQLVLSFYTAAWQQLGKVENPLLGKIERDLEGAALSIDMLDMIRSRTKGNLPEAEAKFLDRTISELKLNYIDELKRKEKEGASEVTKDKSEPAEEKAKENPPETSAQEKTQ